MNTKEKEKTDVVPISKNGDLFSFGEFDHFFDDFLSRRWLRMFEPRLFDWSVPTVFEKGMPKVDILDRDKDIEVHATLPGVNKEDLEVTVTDQSINIRAATKKEEKKEEDRYYHREIMCGEFQRTLAFPENVDSNNAKAAFKDGMLKVTIPKAEKSQCKSVEIK